MVDKRLEQKVNEKIQETLSNIDELGNIAKSLDSQNGGDKSFQYGVMCGRLYNSFYYQSRRILQRDPTKEEFSEFLDILAKRKNEILKRL